MVERYRRGKGKRRLLGNHQKCWIWGRNAVTETLRAGRWPIHELRLADRLPADFMEPLREMAAALDVPVVVESAEELTRRCRSAEHQGFLAKMSPFPYEDAETLLGKRPERPLYAVLDSLQDPYNFGAILRSADAMGVDGVFIGKSRQVGVTSLVARTSAGAVNHVPLARVDDLSQLVRRLRQLRVAVIAAVENAERPVFQCDLCRPAALVLGSEGAGIEQALLEECDAAVGIPQFGQVGSLNAAVAAGILFYEARRQRTVSGQRQAGRDTESPRPVTGREGPFEE